jgi:hypothetical protein
MDRQTPVERFTSAAPENDLLSCLIPVPETKNYTIRAIIRELKIIGVTLLLFLLRCCALFFIVQASKTKKY